MNSMICSLTLSYLILGALSCESFACILWFLILFFDFWICFSVYMCISCSLLLVIFCFVLILVCFLFCLHVYLFSKEDGVGWGRSGWSWGRETHDQDILYKNVFNIRIF